MILLQAMGGNSLIQMLPLLGIMIVFYFFILRPQSQKQKEQADFSTNAAKGDQVVTASGIIGKISAIEGNVVTLEVDKNTFIKMTRSAVSKEMTEAFNKTKA